MRDEYYINGYMMGQLTGHAQLLQALHRLMTAPVHSGYTWEQKYPNTFDLRPNAHAYDPCVIDTLFLSGVPALLNELIGPDMVLTHTQIRRSLPGPSYMDWHRDTYVYDGNRVGNFPPAHKVIFYPRFGGAPHPKLKLVPGSHRLAHQSHVADMRIIDGVEHVAYASSDDQFILFDTSMMHGVIPDVERAGSIRIIYSFLRVPQYTTTLACNPLHEEQFELYTRRLREMT